MSLLNWLTIRKKWDVSVWVLIVFSMTVVIAAWLVGLLFFYYQRAKQEEVYLSILGNNHTSLQDLQDVGLCLTSTIATVTYYPIWDYYKLVCNNGLSKDLTSLNLPSLRVISGCTAIDTECVYKFAK